MGAHGTNKDIATAFVDWLVDGQGGQKIIRDFAINGEILYTIAPPGVDPLAIARGILC